MKPHDRIPPMAPKPLDLVSLGDPLNDLSRIELCSAESSHEMRINFENLRMGSSANLLADVVVKHREFETELKELEFTQQDIESCVTNLRQTRSERARLDSLDRLLKIGISKFSPPALSCCVRAGKINDDLGPRRSTTVQLENTDLENLISRFQALEEWLQNSLDSQTGTQSKR